MITDINKYLSDIQAALNNDIGEGCINKLRANVLAHQVWLVRKELAERAAKTAESAPTSTNTAMDKICQECNGSGLPKFVNQTNCTLCKGRGKLRHC